MKVLSLLLLVIMTSCSSSRPSKESLTATNWYQTSGEARALYYQGYNLAKLSFEQAIKKKTKKLKAVIVDIDETILDNSPYQAKLIEENASYPTYWADWIEKNSAAALPGAVEFLQYVDKKDATVFYISNRKEKERERTYEHLKDLGFPIKDSSQILAQTDKSDKSDRRAKIREMYEVVLLVGDNLNDFDGVFEKKSVEQKEKLVDQMKSEFGPKFIILPNPLYGDWEGALYDYNYNVSDKEKHERRMKALKTF